MSVSVLEGRVADVDRDDRPTAQPAPERRILTEARIVFVLSTALYLTVGALLVFHFHSVLGDSMSRVGNAYYMIYSRDPKLAAVGFVWMPLPSLLMVPFLPLKALWPALVSRGFLGNIESAFAMAGAVVILRSILEELGVARSTRIILVALFACNPMILYYGANGMSEALLLLFTLGAVRSLGRWMDSASSRDLVAAGTMLALAYFTRYEALFAAGVAIAFVATISFLRAWDDPPRRGAIARSDALVVGFPVVVTFVSWTLASWFIVGHPFDTFTSRYGNAAQVSSASASQGLRATIGGSLVSGSSFVAREVFALAPLLLPLLVIAAVVAWRRRDEWLTVPVAILGALMAFQGATTAAKQSFGWLRFQITAIPLSVLLVGYLLASSRQRTRSPVSLAKQRRELSRWGALGAAALVVVVMGASVVTTLRAWADPSLGREELANLVPVWPEMIGKKHFPRMFLGDFDGEQAVAGYVDALHPPRGSVLVDVALGFPIVLASRHPSQFVITTDRDFPDAVGDPAAAGIRYILISPNTGSMDAIAAVYPDLYATGARFSYLVKEFPPPHGNGRSWRLYELRDTAGAP
jgi:hypothetical protein